jgi:hypothetical protein
MPYLNIPDSPLTSGVNLLVSKTIGEVQVRISSEISNLEQSLNLCPESDKLNVIKDKISTLKDSIGSSINRITKLGNITQPLETVVRSLEVLIITLQAVPIPGVATTVGLNVKYANILQTLKELKRQASDDVSIVNSLINSPTGAISLLQRIQRDLETLDRKLQRCTNQTAEVQTPSTQTIGNLPSNSTVYVGPDGNSYIIEVVTVDSTQVAPLRQAVAIDRLKVIRYKSDLSFSSSTNVLIKEVKFRIDNNILT